MKRNTMLAFTASTLVALALTAPAFDGEASALIAQEASAAERIASTRV